jgi:hypothetical protein
MMEKLTNAKLTGAVGISLNVDSMISSIDELKSRNMLEMWNQMAGKGLINEKEWVKEMTKARGLNNPLLVLSDAPEITQGEAPPPMDANAFAPESALQGQMLTEGISPQTNL